MASSDPKQTGGFFASLAAGLSNFGSAMNKSVNGYINHRFIMILNLFNFDLGKIITVNYSLFLDSFAKSSENICYVRLRNLIFHA
jgi:hypothetical protein